MPPAKKPSKSPATLIVQLLWDDRKLIIGTLIALLAIYSIALREPFSVSRCHTASRNTARQMLKQRLQSDPDNATLQAAARNNLYANEDYAPAFKDCMINRGYRE